MSAAIEVEGVSKAYGDVRALAGFELRAEAGTVLGLLGPNGAGKTTAVRVLTTLLEPDAGSARVLGLDVVADASRLRARIGMAGQYAAVDENLTGRENLELVGRLYRRSRAEARARAGELLERFDLADAGDRLAREYSGGMRRRLDLAAALVNDPEVLFLDEPTTGLDPRSRLALWETIEARVAAGTTVLLTTQYLEEADRLADRIAVIDHGRVIAEGTATELKNRVGGHRIEVALEDAGQAGAAVAALASVAAEPPVADGAVVRARSRSRAAPSPRRCGASTTRACGSPTSRCAGRRSTTCSSSSPATPRRTRRPTGAAREADGHRCAADGRRNLRRLPRNPDLLVGFTVQPVMFVVLFTYLFGGAIEIGVDYADFLLPGIVIQMVAFTGYATALGINEDLRKGIIDRFRSLPMARSAVLAGRALSDQVMTVLTLVSLVATGLVVGFSFHASALEVLAGVGLIFLFSHAMSWIYAYIGLVASSTESASAMINLTLFPLTFLSSVYVPPRTMPAVFEAIAQANPLSCVVDTLRSLWIGVPAGPNDAWAAVAWCVALAVVFSLVATRTYRRATAH